MSFDEIRFPTLISWGFGGGPEYNTDIVILSSGHEKRNSNWEIARAKYEVGHNLKSQTQLDELIAFFRARKGQARGFRFRDWNDYKLIDENIGVGDGIETQFQITKTYTSLTSEVRDIVKIVTQSDSDTIAGLHGSTATDWEVKVNSVLQVEGPGNDYTIDRDTGIITFNSPVTDTHIITVSGEFDVPVRFDTDRMVATYDAHNDQNWDGVPLIELKI